MSLPKVGMYSSDVRKRVLRIDRFAKPSEGKNRLIRSLLNQARLHEGEDAKTEIEEEMASLKKRASPFSGAGQKQIGACFEFRCQNRDILCDECLRKDKLVLGNP